MNSYEFWNDMDKIFDAIVAYQEKTIEFNKRFISPWVNLGKVFDKTEGNETLLAHKNAIEIDPKNAQNWYGFGSALMQAGNFDESIQAYQKALELGFESGELYKNLASAHTFVGKYREAIPFLEKGLELTEKDEEIAALWNQLGNVYRKLNDYAMALQAFQHADHFDVKQAEPSKDQPVLTIVDETAEVLPEEPVISEENFVSPEPTMEVATVEVATVLDPEVVSEETEVHVEEMMVPGETIPEEELGNVPQVAAQIETEEDPEIDNEMPVILNLDFSTEKSTWASEEAMIDVEDDENTTTEAPESEFIAALEENSEVMDTLENLDEELEPEVQGLQEDLPATLIDLDQPIELNVASHEEDHQEIAIDEQSFPEAQLEVVHFFENISKEKIENPENDKQKETVSLEDEKSDDFIVVSLSEQDPFDENFEENEDHTGIDEGLKSSPKYDNTPLLSVYEEYLKYNTAPMNVNVTEEQAEEAQTVSMALNSVAVVEGEGDTDSNVDLTADMDTKNAHVWNELGNVYFNAGSYNDAISAYIKAIELDRQFAWAYSNLAMSYVEKGRFDDAILLYERSIELFSDEKDKSVTWNRLGNVYRRLNDYENAIDAYQRADDIDPANATINQQSRFSLLGNDKIGQEVKYTL